MDPALLGRIALAAFLGYVIGWEREFRGKPAGERTFALVALGAAAFTAVGVDRFHGSDRIIQGVVTGIGFLGAGLIFRTERGLVHGLTTAASAWSVAAVGVLCGAGDYALGLTTALLVLVILEANHLPAVRRIDARRQRSRGEDGTGT